ncbi:squalene synthase HpnC [Deefgea piscis]|uniref:Squalene synthase HpnC n=1 Tax=Deefgea piscis TaxID=2739061 RepID=A0A6M8SSF7_9NEIS|nr:squalene synthase HpnC [Deefgea piscis]QKJ67008.1 squalene synthase HpnC [Deefgea piscis]
MKGITSQHTVEHYENFPVGSFLLPKQYRPAVAVVYHVARYADDLADEGHASASERLAALDECSAELQRIERGEMALTARFQALAPVVQRYQIPLQLFEDLFSAFRQDVVKNRYQNFGEVIDYCRRSANPVGRILLHIFDQTDARQLALSDGICSALQLVNFWQDVAIDWQKDRVYLPQDDLLRFAVTEQDLANGIATPAFKQLMHFQCDRTRRMLRAGSPLGVQLPGRVGLEIRTIVLAADRVLSKIQTAQYDVFNARPTLSRGDWPAILWQALKTGITKKTAK